MPLYIPLMTPCGAFAMLYPMALLLPDSGTIVLPLATLPRNLELQQRKEEWSKKASAFKGTGP